MNLSAILNIITGALEQGLIYGILALGLLITYRILDFPDLTVDSSFPLGAAITALMTVNGYPPVLSLFAAAAAGAVAGLVTGLIHVRCHVRDLLSGIITKAGLFGLFALSGQLFLHDAGWGLAVLLFAVVVLVITLLTDICFSFVDPRVKLQ